VNAYRISDVEHTDVLSDIVQVSALKLKKIKQMKEYLHREATFDVPDNYEINTLVHAKSPLIDVEVPVHAVDIEKETYNDERELLFDSLQMTSGPLTSPHVANQVLMKVAPNSSRLADNRATVSIDEHRNPREGRSVRFKNQDALAFDQNDTNIVVCANLFGMRQMNNLNHQLATTVERYCANTRADLTAEEEEMMAEKLFKGFSKFVAVDKLRLPTVEEKELCRAQALLRVAVKSQQPLGEIYGETWESTTRIKGFNKVQIKSKIGEEAWLNMREDDDGPYVKGGQMISAQPKEVNQIAAMWVNWTERQVFENMLPGVYPGYGHSPRQLANKITKTLAKVKCADYPTVSCDISEQDTTKSKCTDDFMRRVYRLVGVPDHVIDIIEKPNKEWHISTGNTSARVKYQYQSGRADTLFSNTCHTMGVAGMSFDFDDLALALFQGDDFMMRASKIERTFDFFEKLKVDECPIGDFVGFLITQKSLFLDIPRIAARLMTKPINDDGRYEELREAANDLTNLHISAGMRKLNVDILPAKYPKLSKGDAEVLWEFIVAYGSPNTKCYKPSNLEQRRYVPQEKRKVAAEILTNFMTTFHFHRGRRTLT